MKKTIFFLPIALTGCLYLGVQAHFNETIATHQQVRQDVLEHVPQNYHAFNEGDTYLVPQDSYDAQAVMQAFSKYYFSPWTNPSLCVDLETLKLEQEKMLTGFIDNPGYGINRHPIDTKVMEKIGNAMDLVHFPNLQQKAMTIQGTHLRELPTHISSFGDWEIPGEGYPFDNIQSSFLHAYEPLYIMHQSLDKTWSFVVTNNCCWGWVLSHDIAFVSDSFAQDWQTSEYVTPQVEYLS